MSILVVENLSHSFGGRVIFEDVSFRLNRGEHVGLVGANGEGKSTFMNILTKKLEPEEGKVLWNKRVNVGYLDQHTVLDPAKTIRDVLKSAYDELYDIEQSITDDYMKMADMDEKEMNVLLEDIGERQSYLDQHDFYLIDSKIDEISRAFSIDALGLDTNVSNLSGGQRTRILMAKLLLQKPDILLLDEPTNYLDVEHIEWLKNYLINYENAFILISHDVPFLNTCINVVYHVDAPSITRYTGNYDNFVSVYETFPANSEIIARPFGFLASKSSSTRGRPCVISPPAIPPVWNVRIVSCVPGSPIDCAAIIPTDSPIDTKSLLASPIP